MKTLHTAYRVTDLAVSLDFYSALGYERVGRDTPSDEAALAMLKFPGEEVVTLELVHRPAEGPCRSGPGYALTDPDGYRVELVEWPAAHADTISPADLP